MTSALQHCPCCGVPPVNDSSIEHGVSIRCANAACSIRPRIDQKEMYAMPERCSPEQLAAEWNALTPETAKAKSDAFAVWVDRAVANVRAAYAAMPEDKKAAFRAEWKRLCEEQRQQLEVTK